MKHRQKSRRRNTVLPVLDVPARAMGSTGETSKRPGKSPRGQTLTARPRRNYARWRALTLSLVYVLFAIHIIHWKIAGKTLAPLELNEVMYTLELGIITAGFLFMCFLVLGTMLFGRFFCSWACHIMVLQDLCAWLLRKLRIRQKPIRSRLLLLVPPLAAFYMFMWPQVVRMWHTRALPTFHFATDAQGWGSFVTDNFWRNLPGAPIIVLTFLVCGFVMVYLMGSRTFCTYVCPYGAVFALADRFAPGRIRVTDACQQCGTCTAVCTSGIRVHEGVAQHGMIVNPSCMKDLDCVGACPQNALFYSFGKPSLVKSFKSGGRFGRLPYDFSLREEVLLSLVFIVVLLSFRGLYSRIPFLLSLALGGILGYLAVLTVRLFTRPHVMLATLHLKRLGRFTLGGRAYLGVAVLLAAFVGHSAFIRYHEFLGLKQVLALGSATGKAEGNELAASAFAHLRSAERWGLLDNERAERSLLTAAFYLQRFDDVQTYAARMLKRNPYDNTVRLPLGQFLARQNRTVEAEREFRAIITQWGGEVDDAPHALISAYLSLGELLARRGDFAAAASELRTVVALDRSRAAAHAGLGSALAELGRFDDAIASLRTAVELEPQMNEAHYNLGTILGHQGRFDEAIPCYLQALVGAPEDAAIHNNLGFALMRTGQLDESRKHLERAVALDPDNADAHFNLGTMFSAQRQLVQANEHYLIAARLDPRYARLLDGASQR